MRLGLAALLLLALAACGDNEAATETEAPAASSTGPSVVTDGGVALHAAVQAYSDAYLTGDAPTAFDMLSSRCQTEIGKQPFTADVTAAGENFGDPLPLKTFEGKFGENEATITYTYSIAALNQGDQPWVLEDGAWKYDAC